MICTSGSFNQLLADILFRALEGTSFNMTDGSQNYNGVKNHVIDPVHKTRAELRHDPKFREMKKELSEAAKKAREAKSEEEKKQAADVRKGKIEEVSRYAEAKYHQEVLKSTVEQVRTEHHPDLFDGESDFKGRAITSNGAEGGGNWRVKNAVRVPYARSDSAAGKSILATIRDSVSTIRAGKAMESVANRVGAFTFGRVMMAA